MSEGWICPVCRRGVSPTERHCDHGDPLLTSVFQPFISPAQPSYPGGGTGDPPPGRDSTIWTAPSSSSQSYISSNGSIGNA